MSDTVRVTDNEGRRIHFEGTDRQCRDYVEAHFPRMHVEPGINKEPESDVKLSTGETFDGETWSDERDEAE